MKIASLSAEKVHGYLDIKLEFFDDLTFLVGLNGSGKTTALRILMALLTPKIEDIGSLNFSFAKAIVVHNGEEVAVSLKKSSEGVELEVRSSNESKELTLSSAELQVLSDAKNKDDRPTILAEKIDQNEAIKIIRDMSTPMFLGLDRRFITPSVGRDDIIYHRRELYVRRLWESDPNIRGSNVASLADINFLIVTRFQEVLKRQQVLDEELRRKLLMSSFEYKPVGFAPSRMPKQADFAGYRDRLVQIQIVAESLKLPVPDLEAALKTYLDRMESVVDALERSQKGNKSRHEKVNIEQLTIEWMVNRPQADRIQENMNLILQYVDERKQLRSQLDNFLGLVNSFFTQTRKAIGISSSGELVVQIEGATEPRSITALSSGEKQILVMLAHLSLNEDLADSGVFIVDEPELSLHIDWQEKFVDSVRRANESVQLIMATHSPAIILDHTEHCVAIGGNNA